MDSNYMQLLDWWHECKTFYTRQILCYLNYLACHECKTFYTLQILQVFYPMRSYEIFFPQAGKGHAEWNYIRKMLLWVPFNFSYLENWFRYSIFLGGKLVNRSNVVHLKWLHEKSRLTPYPTFIYTFSSLMVSKKKFHPVLPMDSDQNSDSWNRITVTHACEPEIFVIYLFIPNLRCVFYA